MCSLTSGCRSLKLDPKWKPLEIVEESVYQSKGIVSTIGNTLIVYDLDTWQRGNPKGSINRESLLRHERVHSYRQKKYGLTKYLYRYWTDKEFRWQEEQHALYACLTYKKKMKKHIYVKSLAHFLSGPVYCRMISYNKAKTFVESVLNGSWKPIVEMLLK